MENTYVVGGRYGSILCKTDDLELANNHVQLCQGAPHKPVRLEKTPPGPHRVLFQDISGKESCCIYGPEEYLRSRYFPQTKN